MEFLYTFQFRIECICVTISIENRKREEEKRHKCMVHIIYWDINIMIMSNWNDPLFRASAVDFSFCRFVLSSFNIDTQHKSGTRDMCFIFYTYGRAYGHFYKQHIHTHNVSRTCMQLLFLIRLAMILCMAVLLYKHLYLFQFLRTGFIDTLTCLTLWILLGIETTKLLSCTECFFRIVG